MGHCGGSGGHEEEALAGQRPEARGQPWGEGPGSAREIWLGPEGYGS